jgi:hypothetical protein
MGMQINITAIKITDSFDKKKLNRPTNIDYKEMDDMMNKFKGLYKQN